MVHDRLMDHGKNAWAFTHAQLAIRKRNKTCALPRALLREGQTCGCRQAMATEQLECHGRRDIGTRPSNGSWKECLGLYTRATRHSQAKQNMCIAKSAPPPRDRLCGCRQAMATVQLKCHGGSTTGYWYVTVTRVYTRWDGLGGLNLSESPTSSYNASGIRV